MLRQWCSAHWRANLRGFVTLTFLCALISLLVASGARCSWSLGKEIPESFAQGFFRHPRIEVKASRLSSRAPFCEVRLFYCKQFEGLTLLRGRWPGPNEVVVERSSLSLLGVDPGVNLRLQPQQAMQWPVVGEVWDPTQAPGQMDRCIYLYTLGSAKGREVSTPASHPHAGHMRGVLLLLTCFSFLSLFCGGLMVVAWTQRMLAQQEADLQLLRFLGADFSSLRRRVAAPIVGALGLGVGLGWLFSFALSQAFLTFARGQLNLPEPVGEGLAWMELGLLALLSGVPVLTLWLILGNRLRVSDGIYWSAAASAPPWFSRIPVRLALAWGGFVQQRGRFLLCLLSLVSAMTLWVVATTVASSASLAIQRALTLQPWNCELVGLGPKPSQNCWGWSEVSEGEVLSGTATQLSQLTLQRGRLPRESSGEFVANGAWSSNHRDQVGLVSELGPARRYQLESSSSVASGWLMRWRGTQADLERMSKSLLDRGQLLVSAQGPAGLKEAATEHLHIFVILLGGLSAFLFVLGCLSLAAHLERSLQERRPDLLSLLAMGTSPNLVRRCLLLEAGSLLLLSGLVACAVGLPSGLAIARGLLETSLHIPCSLVVPVPALTLGAAAATLLVWTIVPRPSLKNLLRSCE